VRPAGTCGDCMYSAILTVDGFEKPILSCRAEPPRPCVLPGNRPGEMRVVGMHPPVDRGGWCARYQAEPQGTPQ